MHLSKMDQHAACKTTHQTNKKFIMKTAGHRLAISNNVKSRNVTDDIIIFGKTSQELLDRLHQVFQRLAEVGLKVKPSKTVLFKTEIDFLGHSVTAQGVNPMPDKIQAIRDWPTPHCLRDVRAFVGLASYYRRFVRNFASIAEPLTRLTKKNNIPFRWTDDADHAFRQLKDALLNSTTLAFPIPGNVFWTPTPRMLL